MPGGKNHGLGKANREEKKQTAGKIGLSVARRVLDKLSTRCTTAFALAVHPPPRGRQKCSAGRPFQARNILIEPNTVCRPEGFGSPDVEMIFIGRTSTLMRCHSL